MKERIQKILSAQGVCSRRQAEIYIRQGRVKVNGITAGLGESADINRDVVTFDGREVADNITKLYIMLNKPRGYVTTLADERGRPEVAELVQGVEERVYPVGRLDMDSEGLLLMTNDGRLTQALTHPSHRVYKTYHVAVTYGGAGAPPMPPEAALSRPMTIDGRPISPAVCQLLERRGPQYVLSIAIREGRNRQIRKMCAQAGYRVDRLKRVAVGDLQLGDLSEKKWRYLTAAEVRYLKSLAREG